MTGRHWLAGFALLIIAEAAKAQAPSPAERGVYIFGVGQKECSDFVDEAEKERSARQPDTAPDTVLGARYGMFVSWSDGYISSYNGSRAASSFVGSKTTIGARSRWLENYYREHPLENFLAENENLVMALIGQGQQANK